jgi:hypothetical protein
MKAKIILSSLVMLVGLNMNGQEPTNQLKPGEKGSKKDGNSISYGNESQTQENPKVTNSNAKDAFIDPSKKSQKDPTRYSKRLK